MTGMQVASTVGLNEVFPVGGRQTLLMLHAPKIVAVVVTLTLAAISAPARTPVIRTDLKVAPVWSGHPVGFHLLTHRDRQFVAFYDAERRMTVAARSLHTNTWTFSRLPETVGWDSHNYVTFTVDRDDYMHLSGNMHGGPLVYFRSHAALDSSTFERIKPMVGEAELRTTYPRFFSGPKGELIFTYRTGGSGNGDQIYNRYDPDARVWHRLLDQPLIAGEGRNSAYLQGPTLGPDGWFHLIWMWRETPDCATCHNVSYVRSRDLVNWETSNGRKLALPITLATCEIVDPVPVRGGLLNVNLALGFDARNRPILSYHKYDTNGFLQAYNARLEAGQWRIHQATDWEYRWEFSGGGSIDVEVRVSGVVREADGTLTQSYSHPKHGSAKWKLDTVTLRPVSKVNSPSIIPPALRRVESSFPGMRVQWRAGVDTRTNAPTQFHLRWETLGPNRDRPRSGTPPPPSWLRVVEITRAAMADTSLPSAEDPEND